MARSLCNTKMLLASVSDALSLSITRRGYTAAATASVASFSRGGSTTGIMRNTEMRAAVKEDSGSTWALDPIKGYYRPQNCAADIDPAELREMLLNHKVRLH